MEALWLIVEEEELEDAGPDEGEVREPGHLISKDKHFRVVLFVVVDEEVIVLSLLERVSAVVN